MGCYWEISGDVVAKKGSFEEVVDLLESYGIDTDEDEDEKISFTYYGSDLYDMPDELDNDLRPLVQSGEFTAKSDEENITGCFRYGREPYYEETTVLEYYPSEIDKFVETLPQDVIDAVLKEYAKPAAKEQELRVQTPAGPIVAKVISDDNYPGIIIKNEKEPGQPSAILEYDSDTTAFGDAKSCMQLCVYDEANPYDAPVAIYQMSKDLREKEDKNV